MSKPLILVTNDDGITSRGIRRLISLMQQLGEVVVVAPDSPQSGMGHAITVGDILRLTETDIYPGLQAFKCSGTPADCVKMAKDLVLKSKNPDLVVSGINHGSNTSISVLYSGTMSAAIEAAIENMPAIGFSLCDYESSADMDHVDEYVLRIAKEALVKDMGHGVALNVNFPAKQKESIQGIRICRQANAKWQEDFDQRVDPYGRKYFWMTGNFINHDKGEDNDEWAIANNFVSVVPCQFDLTSYHAINLLNDDWNFE
ncbi:MAG: 5'/3'-nucleotidase SurE [Bacteroidetes bacterium]|nr:5'/3'-nucleotidase SurE [Bacteroidota bacterium]